MSLTSKRGIEMSAESIAMAGGTTLGGKVIALVAFFVVTLVAFFLGLQVIPLDEKDPHKDVVRRLVGCAISSLVVGLPALAFMHNTMPWMYTSIAAVFNMMDIDPTYGPKLINWSILLVAGLPGWWLVGAVVRQVAGWRDKTIKQIKEEVL